MIQAIRQIFRPRGARTRHAIPAGQRVYAIGDIHGRLDLFAGIAQAIEEDDAARGAADTTVVLLGDLVDRGPQSAAVLDGARAWQKRRKVRILLGNHEEMFLASHAKARNLRNFLRFGGYETLLSYGVDEAAFRLAEIEEAHAMMRAVVPAEDLAFMRGFEDHVAIGDYLFVHAGIRPEETLADQDVKDLRWIREPFLSHGGDHGCMVVHGHTITDAPEMLGNRIGIDTGAYASGRLTALGLEGTERWLIETQDDGGVISVTSRPA